MTPQSIGSPQAISTESQAFADGGVEADVTTWAAQLREQGVCIIPDLVSRCKIEELGRQVDPVFDATPFCQGAFYGSKTKRFGQLLSRAPASRALVTHPLILAITERILGPYCDMLQLNLTQAIEIHPGELAQVPHRDQDMWQGSNGGGEFLVNVIWPITPFHANNGATVIWPKPHGENVLAEPTTRGIAAECEPGDAILFLGSTLHHGGANLTDLPRRAMVTGYSLGWLKTYENQFLAYPPAIARTFDPELAALIGYRQHRPNLGNYEGQCPSILLGNDVPHHLAAIDALRPDQVEMVSAYRSAQIAGQACKGPGS